MPIHYTRRHTYTIRPADYCKWISIDCGRITTWENKQTLHTLIRGRIITLCPGVVRHQCHPLVHCITTESTDICSTDHCGISDCYLGLPHRYARCFKSTGTVWPTILCWKRWPRKRAFKVICSFNKRSERKIKAHNIRCLMDTLGVHSLSFPPQLI